MTDNTRSLFSIIIFILFLCAGDLYSWRTFNRATLGSEAEGVGGAYVGDASSEFADYYNPAGLVQLSSNLSFTYEISSAVEIADFLNWNVTVAFDYFTFFALNGSLGAWKWGVSATTLFQSLLDGNSFSIRSLNFTAAYPVLPNLSLGAGIGPVLASENSGYGFSYAYNIGLLWKVTDDLQLGICFHSPIDMQWSFTELGGSLSESYPFIVDLGGMYRLNEKMFLFGSLEYVNVDSIRYVLNHIDYSPVFGGNFFARVHPHFGLQFLEENTGAHISLGILMDSSYFDGGSLNQYRLTAGVRAYGKNLVFSASIIDSLLINIFYPDNLNVENINVSFSFRL